MSFNIDYSFTNINGGMKLKKISHRIVLSIALLFLGFTTMVIVVVRGNTYGMLEDVIEDKLVSESKMITMRSLMRLKSLQETKLPFLQKISVQQLRLKMMGTGCLEPQ